MNGTTSTHAGHVISRWNFYKKTEECVCVCVSADSSDHTCQVLLEIMKMK